MKHFTTIVIIFAIFHGGYRCRPSRFGTNDYPHFRRARLERLECTESGRHNAPADRSNAGQQQSTGTEGDIEAGMKASELEMKPGKVDYQPFRSIERELMKMKGTPRRLPGR